jgi:hypothetical protein
MNTEQHYSAISEDERISYIFYIYEQQLFQKSDPKTIWRNHVSGDWWDLTGYISIVLGGIMYLL